ncbi:MAG: hypothetical protein GDA52_01240 [Rhodobacteraceae bacterium]|nr:hypothetical protein [Paracoccaceae bacterium]
MLKKLAIFGLGALMLSACSPPIQEGPIVESFNGDTVRIDLRYSDAVPLTDVRRLSADREAVRICNLGNPGENRGAEKVSESKEFLFMDRSGLFEIPVHANRILYLCLER